MESLTYKDAICVIVDWNIYLSLGLRERCCTNNDGAVVGIDETLTKSRLLRLVHFDFFLFSTTWICHTSHNTLWSLMYRNYNVIAMVMMVLRTTITGDTAILNKVVWVRNACPRIGVSAVQRLSRQWKRQHRKRPHDLTHHSITTIHDEWLTVAISKIACWYVHRYP